MMPGHRVLAPARVRAADGFTLIELLVAMLIATVVTMAAVSFLIFTTEDVSHITARVGVDQTGRVALQRVISELHSACVAPNVIPVLEGSGEKVIKFVSESGEGSAFANVEKHEITFAEGALTEKSYKSTGGAAPSYTWSTTPTTTKLLTGIRQTEVSSTKTPIFRYYRYYREGDAIPVGDTKLPYGEINPEAITPGSTGVSAEEAEDITKVTVNFTVAPEGKESVAFNHDRPVVLEDSAVFRLAPSSEASNNPNLPCTEAT
ncbi:MAG: PilW family protein [Solirubrobacteraceae bacterium]